MKDGKVQTLRGIACILLVIFHVIGATDTQGLRVQGGWMRHLTDALMAVRMPVFGLVAGAMYGLSHKRGLALVRDKWERLILPMLTVGTVFAVVQYLAPGSNGHTVDWHLLHIVPVFHYWFLESLFWIFCWMAVAEHCWPITGWQRWLPYFGLSVLVYVSHPGYIWFGVHGALYLLPYFLLGLALTRLGWDAQQRHRIGGILSAVCGAGIVVLLMHDGAPLNRFSAPMLLAGLLLSAGLWSIGLRHRWLEWIGHYSFAIFLFHVFFTSAVRMAMHASGWTDTLLVLAISVPVGLLGPVLVQRVGSRSSLLRAYVLALPALHRSAA